MDLFVATLIIQDAHYTARKSAAHRNPSQADRRNPFLPFLGNNRPR